MGRGNHVFRIGSVLPKRRSGEINMVRTIIAVAVGGFLGAIVYATMADMSVGGTPRSVYVEVTMDGMIYAGAIIAIVCSLFFSLGKRAAAGIPETPQSDL